MPPKNGIHNMTPQNIRPFRQHKPNLAAGVYVDPSAVVIGDVDLAEDVSVWPLAVIRGDMHSICIGPRTSVQDGSVLHITHDSQFNPGGFALTIGADVTIGHQVMLHGCTIGNRVLVGMKAMIMDGAVIEDEVIIAAGAIVTPGKRLHSGYLYKGTPAQQVRPLTTEEIEFFRYGAGNYVRLKDQYLAEQTAASD